VWRREIKLGCEKWWTGMCSRNPSTVTTSSYLISGITLMILCIRLAVIPSILRSITKGVKLNPRCVLRDLGVARQEYFPYDDLQDALRLRILERPTYLYVLGNIWFIHSSDCLCNLPCSSYHSSLTSKIFQYLCTPSPESYSFLPCGTTGGRLIHWCATFWKRGGVWRSLHSYS